MIQRSVIVPKSTEQPNSFLRVLVDLVLSIPFLLCAALVVIIFIMSGCTQMVILPPCGVYEIRARIHVTEDRSSWPEKQRRPDVAGCATSAGDIYLRQQDFAAWITQERNLGHEVEHLINDKHRVFPNPDKVK
jgi:hypothetical protein